MNTLLILMISIVLPASYPSQQFIKTGTYYDSMGVQVINTDPEDHITDIELYKGNEQKAHLSRLHPNDDTWLPVHPRVGESDWRIEYQYKGLHYRHKLIVGK